MTHIDRNTHTQTNTQGENIITSLTQGENIITSHQLHMQLSHCSAITWPHYKFTSTMADLGLDRIFFSGNGARGYWLI